MVNFISKEIKISDNRYNLELTPVENRIIEEKPYLDIFKNKEKYASYSVSIYNKTTVEFINQIIILSNLVETISHETSRDDYSFVFSQNVRIVELILKSWLSTPDTSIFELNSTILKENEILNDESIIY